jgi:hypothetical protein
MSPRTPQVGGEGRHGLVDAEVGQAQGLSRLGRCALNARWRLVALVVGAEVFEDKGGGQDGNAMVGAFRKFGADRANNGQRKNKLRTKAIHLGKTHK